MSVTVDESIKIEQRPEAVFRFWRNFQNLPQFMSHLRDVRVLDPLRSHWVAAAPMGTSVEWDAEIVSEQANRYISWRSIGNPDVTNEGSVQFDESPEGGCITRVILNYTPPGGKLGAVIAKLFGEEPSQQIRDDLRKLKQLMEAGEIPTTGGQPYARKSGDSVRTEVH